MGLSLELLRVNNYALKDVSLYVGSGELMVVLGPNGAGKTTLLKVIAGLAPYEGTVRIGGAVMDGVPPSRRRIGYAPQGLGLIPTMTVLDNVALPLRARGLSSGEARLEALKLLEQLGLSGIAARYPLKVSGGERRLASIARAIAGRPEILLLDEPTSGLQPSFTRSLSSLILDLARRENYTVLVVTHDVELAMLLGRSGLVTLLLDGRIVATGSLYETVRKAQREYARYTGVNVLACEKHGGLGYGLARYRCGSLSFAAPDSGDRAVLIFSPEEVVEGGGANKVRAELLGCSDGVAYLEAGGIMLSARLGRCGPRGRQVELSVPVYAIRSYQAR